MERKPVTSQMFRSVGYSPETRILEVEFLTGGIYRYHDVSPAEWEDFRTAKSHGAHFSSRIRGRYRTEKVEKEEPFEEKGKEGEGARSSEGLPDAG